MSLAENPFYHPEHFRNRATITRSARARDQRQGGTHQNSVTTIVEHAECTFQQETDNPVMEDQPVRGATAKATVRFPASTRDTSPHDVRFEDRITDERTGQVYVVEEYFDEGGTGWVYLARVNRAG